MGGVRVTGQITTLMPTLLWWEEVGITLIGALVCSYVFRKDVVGLLLILDSLICVP